MHYIYIYIYICICIYIYIYIYVIGGKSWGKDGGDRYSPY